MAPSLFCSEPCTLLPPFLATVQTPDEDSHRLIRRPGLHLPMARLALPAPLALEQIRSLLLITLQHRRLPLQLLICQPLPVLWIQLPRRHEGNLMRRELTLLQSLNQPGVAHIRLGVQIDQHAPCDHLVKLHKVRIFPVAPYTLPPCFI